MLLFSALKKFNHIWLLVVCLTLLLLQSPFLLAAPKAGSIIGNQASATYTDSEGNSYSTTSNLVETIVQPVYGLTLTGDHNTFSPAGGTAYFPHVITNTGNADDTFSLSLTNNGGDDIDFGALATYLDADRDGNPDSATAITSLSLNAGAHINIVVAGSVSSLSTANQVASATLTATSNNDGTQTASVTDTATVRSGAVIKVTKSMSATNGTADSSSDSATAYTVTLSYQNTGNTAASTLTITDPLPPGFHYVDDSGRASLTGTLVLTDDNSAEPSTTNGSVLTYEYDSVNHEIEFTVNTVPSSGSGFVRFQVYVLTTDNDGTVLAAGNIVNTATFAYDDQSAENTNSVQFSVSSQADVTLDNDGLDSQTVASANQGSSASFTHTVTNTGNIDDTFNLAFSGDTFPSGTAFKLFRSDGVTPLVDTNGDGKIDTGLISASGNLTIVLKVIIPPSASGGPNQVTLTATSVYDTLVNDGVNAVVTSITAQLSDLTINDTATNGGDGTGNPGSDGEASPVDSATIQPGNSITLPLFIENNGANRDNYDLLITNLPNGWEVTFYHDTNANGSVDAAEPKIVNTGSVSASGNIAILAVIKTPTSASPGDNDLIVKAGSPNSSAEDYLKFRASIANTYALDVSLDNTSQAAPGTSVVVMHRVKNTGNTASGNITLAVSHSNNQGWSATLYSDDGASTGVLDGSDSVYDPASPPSLAVGAEITIFIRAIVPLSATPGAQNAMTFTATISTPEGDVVDTATDTITVISTEIELIKEQALDSGCDGLADSAFASTSISTGARPGACLIYRITATNSGSEDVAEVVIYDSTPNFSSIESTNHTPSILVNSVSYTATGDCSASTPGVSAPADETSGTVTGYICSLAPGNTGRLEFSVQIDP